MDDIREQLVSIGLWAAADPRDPSADISAAWALVERLREDGWIVRVQEMPEGLPYLAGSGWHPSDGAEIRRRAMCMLYPNPVIREKRGQYVRDVTEFADSSPLAICRAALKAVEVK